MTWGEDEDEDEDDRDEDRRDSGCEDGDEEQALATSATAVTRPTDNTDSALRRSPMLLEALADDKSFPNHGRVPALLTDLVSTAT